MFQYEINFYIFLIYLFLKSNLAQSDCPCGFVGRNCNYFYTDPLITDPNDIQFYNLFDQLKNNKNCYATYPRQDPYYCICKEGFQLNSELKCVENKCNDFSCGNLGRCVMTNNTAECICGLTRNTGLECQTPACFPQLSTYPQPMCLNGNKCFGEDPFDIHCNCDEQYSGKYCEKLNLICPSYITDCQNGATCILKSEFEEFCCLCQKGFTGEFCEITILDSFESIPSFYTYQVSNFNSFIENSTVSLISENRTRKIDFEKTLETYSNTEVIINDNPQNISEILYFQEVSTFSSFGTTLKEIFKNSSYSTNDAETFPIKTFETTNNTHSTWKLETSERETLSNIFEDFSTKVMYDDENSEKTTKKEDDYLKEEKTVTTDLISNHETFLGTSTSFEKDTIIFDNLTLKNELTINSNFETSLSKIFESFTLSNVQNISIQAFDYCNENPCKNNATCINRSEDYKCECSVFFSGKNCEYEEDDCRMENNKCMNNSTCINYLGIGNYECQCEFKNTGKNCELVRNICENRPCLNKGICKFNETGYFYTCLCQEGFNGKNCEIQSDPCEFIECKNGGYCHSSQVETNKTDIETNSTLFIQTTKCVCTSYFYGDFCELEKADYKTIVLVSRSIGIASAISIASVYSLVIILDITKIFCKTKQ
ncbi:unnamed protein product [Brachionus calyciflorus]|uniref:EGF-like domain-containing protein n=1 Tax=Brachionus calyciflorus TaxID=104777 RepID=A0A813Z8G4_9BILA|nr:unnamed protein product [Brachionus calyciflorus]